MVEEKYQRLNDGPVSFISGGDDIKNIKTECFL